jgi:hypothetical protein
VADISPFLSAGVIALQRSDIKSRDARELRSR